MKSTATATPSAGDDQSRDSGRQLVTVWSGACGFDTKYLVLSEHSTGRNEEETQIKS